MRTNYVLIDFENVKPDSLAGLDADHFRVLIFVGASQTRIDLELAVAMQALGSRAQYVRIAGNGSNALDFHIAFYIGHLAASDPTGNFHIISKDAGFDPLIQHLKAKRVSVVRSRSIDDIPPLKATNTQSLSARVSAVVVNLRQRGASRPRTVKALASTLSSLFRKQMSEDQLAELLAELQRLGIVTVHEKNVSYTLTEGKA
ncbi:MAG: PIN domain-containing protein [Planctomycetaceae bacterium]